MSLRKLTAERLHPDDVEVRLVKISDFIVQHCEPEQIILFGSAARGEMTDASDIDLIVLCKDRAHVAVARQAYFQHKPVLDTAVDIMFIATADFAEAQQRGGVCYVAAREGRRLYPREVVT